MRKKRPINLDLTTIKFPIPAIVSIFHRISGVLLFIFTPFALWALQQSLASPSAFYDLQEVFSRTSIKWLLWMFFAALSYHLIAGIRHLIMDLGIGESLEGGRRGAILVFILFAVAVVMIGVWIW